MIRIIRKTMSRILYYSGITYIFQKIGNRNTIILVYHRVLDLDSNFELDLGLVSASIGNFEKQMKYLSRKYNVISLEDFLEYHKKKINPPKNSVVITFDDGYKDNYQNAYPILKKYNFPATIFLATDAIENKRLFWWDRLAHIISRTRIKSFELKELGRFSLSDSESKFKSLNFIETKLKKINESEKNKILEQMSKLLKVDSPVIDQKNRLFLSWNEIRQMFKNSISFGAHTISHVILSRVSLKKADKEIKESKKAIEKNLGKKINFFCYPNGYEWDFNENIKKLVKKNGFDSAASYVPGTNSINSDLLELRRLFVRYDEDILMFKNKLVGFDIFPARIYLFFEKIKRYLEDFT